MEQLDKFKPEKDNPEQFLETASTSLQQVGSGEPLGSLGAHISDYVSPGVSLSSKQREVQFLLWEEV